jgi:hypothetical protein
LSDQLGNIVDHFAVQSCLHQHPAGDSAIASLWSENQRTLGRLAYQEACGSSN